MALCGPNDYLIRITLLSLRHRSTTMSFKDKLKTNKRKVQEGFDKMHLEWLDTTDKTKEALTSKDYTRALHHASGYLEAAIQHPHRFHFYMWLPKWAAVIWLICGACPL